MQKLHFLFQIPQQHVTTSLGTYSFKLDILHSLWFEQNAILVSFRAAVKRARLEMLIASLYNSLSKRIPPSSASPTGLKTMASWLFSWIITAFSAGSNAKEESSLRVRTLKTLLATLCAGKLMDKLRYIFSQLADSNGHLVSRATLIQIVNISGEKIALKGNTK